MALGTYLIIQQQNQPTNQTKNRERSKSASITNKVARLHQKSYYEVLLPVSWVCSVFTYFFLFNFGLHIFPLVYFQENLFLCSSMIFKNISKGFTHSSHDLWVARQHFGDIERAGKLLRSDNSFSPWLEGRKRTCYFYSIRFQIFTILSLLCLGVVYNSRIPLCWEILGRPIFFSDFFFF